MSEKETNRRLDASLAAVDEKLERLHRESHAILRALEQLTEAIQTLVCREDEPQKVEITVRIVMERPEPCVYPKSTGGTISVTG